MLADPFFGKTYETWAHFGRRSWQLLRRHVEDMIIPGFNTKYLALFVLQVYSNARIFFLSGTVMLMAVVTGVGWTGQCGCRGNWRSGGGGSGANCSNNKISHTPSSYHDTHHQGVTLTHYQPHPIILSWSSTQKHKYWLHKLPLWESTKASDYSLSVCMINPPTLHSK